jgi:hypothetical protein
MKTTQRGRLLLLMTLLSAPLLLALQGCGGDEGTVPKDIGQLKTPSQVLEEAKAKDAAAKPAAK